MLGDVIVFVPIEHSPLKEPVKDLSERIDISVDLGSICLPSRHSGGMYFRAPTASVVCVLRPSASSSAR